MELEDRDLGNIKLVKNIRAKRITVRFRNGQYLLSYPPYLTLSVIKSSIQQMKPGLLLLKEKSPQKQLITPLSSFSTFSFKLEIDENSLTHYYSRLKDGILYITYPQGTDYTSVEAQAEFRNHIEKAMRYDAKRLLPLKVDLLAKKYGFIFDGVKINKSQSRWGSCSSRKAINLSYYCMLLPEYLADFVILHELCHTVEMNHGERFWSLLDKVSDGRARILTKELKTYKTNW